MPLANHDLGRFGEAAAAAHLRRAGYVIVGRNWRCPLGELDLVARKGDQMLFVEVKTRHVGAWLPEDALGPAKARRLVQLAYTYLTELQLPLDSPWRIDLIAIELDAAGRICRLDHIEGAVEGEG
ncbi:YraN family protein [Candidatus Chloroploca sp. M-50]|uniref:UPF0102 protein EYB53_007430 n=1 Tax=Candidatus Chloroploca mongolica TaxID=2528176 RepID=A0ABS4D7Z5_9CHLR|nr:YraN family protein [Candidatus Chloroploca mongolica]